MNEPGDHPLASELDHWYGVCELRYRQLLEAVTALDLAAAERHLELFRRLLTGTLESGESALEEAGVDGVDSEDRELVRTDFMILRRSLPGLAEALEQLQQVADEQANLRGAMVDRLDGFVRVANILARHHDRVEAGLFPLLQANLDHDRGREMADQLSASMQRAQPN